MCFRLIETAVFARAGEPISSGEKAGAVGRLLLEMSDGHLFNNIFLGGRGGTVSSLFFVLFPLSWSCTSRSFSISVRVSSLEAEQLMYHFE